MKLVVALGNPGKKYEHTRHNVGSWTLSLWVKEKGVDFPHTKFLFPKTFMNLSGGEVKKAMAFSKISPDNVLIIHDDMDLSLGKIKISFGSRSGGHNGVQSIIDHIGTKDFYRLRIGVNPFEEEGQLSRRTDPAKFILQKFTSEEISTLKSLKEKIFREIERFISR